MIIDNGYFINEIFLPQAKEDVAGSVLEVEEALSFFIAKYEQDCLLKCLGFKLFNEFMGNIDYATPTKIKEGSDEKWNKLLNGCDYVDSNGNEKKWKGMRSKNISSNVYNVSFIANYIYYFHEKSDASTKTNAGNVQEASKNSTNVSKMPKVTFAWNEFVDSIGVPNFENKAFVYNGFLCEDYFTSNQEVTLYEFITDLNEIDPTTYEDYRPYVFERINEFGI